MQGTKTTVAKTSTTTTSTVSSPPPRSSSSLSTSKSNGDTTSTIATVQSPGTASRGNRSVSASRSQRGQSVDKLNEKSPYLVTEKLPSLHTSSTINTTGTVIGLQSPSRSQVRSTTSLVSPSSVVQRNDHLHSVYGGNNRPNTSSSPHPVPKSSSTATTPTAVAKSSVSSNPSSSYASNTHGIIGLSLPIGMKLSLELDKEIVKRIITHQSYVNQAKDIATKINYLYRKFVNLQQPQSSPQSDNDSTNAENIQSIGNRINTYVTSLINLLLHTRIAAVAVVEAVVTWRVIQQEMLTARYLVKESTNTAMPFVYQRLVSTNRKALEAHHQQQSLSASKKRPSVSRRRARFADGGVPGGLRSPGEEDTFVNTMNGTKKSTTSHGLIDTMGSIELTDIHDIRNAFGTSTALAAATSSSSSATDNGTPTASSPSAHHDTPLLSITESSSNDNNTFNRMLSDALHQIPVYTYGGEDVLGSLATSMDFLANVIPFITTLNVDPDNLPLNPFMAPASLKAKAEAIIGIQRPFIRDSTSRPTSRLHPNNTSTHNPLLSPQPVHDPVQASALASTFQRPVAPSSAVPDSSTGGRRRGRSALTSGRMTSDAPGLGLGDEDSITGKNTTNASATTLRTHTREIPIRVISSSPTPEEVPEVEEETEDNDDGGYDDDDFEDDNEENKDEKINEPSSDNTVLTTPSKEPMKPTYEVIRTDTLAQTMTVSASSMVMVGIPAEGKNYVSVVLHLMLLSESPLIRAIGRCFRSVFEGSNNDSNVSSPLLTIPTETTLESRISSAERVLLHHTSILTGDVPLQSALNAAVLLPLHATTFYTNEAASALKEIRKRMLTGTGGKDDSLTLVPTLISFEPKNITALSGIRNIRIATNEKKRQSPNEKVGDMRALVDHIGASAGIISNPPSAYLNPISFTAPANDNTNTNVGGSKAITKHNDRPGSRTNRPVSTANTNRVSLHSAQTGNRTSQTMNATSNVTNTNNSGPSPYSIVDRRAMEILATERNSTGTATMGMSRPRTGGGGGTDARGSGIAAARATATARRSVTGTMLKTGNLAVATPTYHSALLSSSVGTLSGISTTDHSIGNEDRAGTMDTNTTVANMDTTDNRADTVRDGSTVIPAPLQHNLNAVAVEYDFTAVPPTPNGNLPNPLNESLTMFPSIHDPSIQSGTGKDDSNSVVSRPTTVSFSDKTLTKPTHAKPSTSSVGKRSTLSPPSRRISMTSSRTPLINGSINGGNNHPRPSTSALTVDTNIPHSPSKSPHRKSILKLSGSVYLNDMPLPELPPVKSSPSHHPSQSRVGDTNDHHTTTVSGMGDTAYESAVHVSSNRKDISTLFVKGQVTDTIAAAWQLTRSVYTNNTRANAAYETYMARKQAILEMASSQAVTSGPDGKPRSAVKVRAETIAASKLQQRNSTSRGGSLSPNNRSNGPLSSANAYNNRRPGTRSVGGASSIQSGKTNPSRGRTGPGSVATSRTVKQSIPSNPTTPVRSSRQNSANPTTPRNTTMVSPSMSEFTTRSPLMDNETNPNPSIMNKTTDSLPGNDTINGFMQDTNRTYEYKHQESDENEDEKYDDDTIEEEEITETKMDDPITVPTTTMDSVPKTIPTTTMTTEDVRPVTAATEDNYGNDDFEDEDTEDKTVPLVPVVPMVTSNNETIVTASTENKDHYENGSATHEPKDTTVSTESATNLSAEEAKDPPVVGIPSLNIPDTPTHQNFSSSRDSSRTPSARATTPSATPSRPSSVRTVTPSATPRRVPSATPNRTTSKREITPSATPSRNPSAGKISAVTPHSAPTEASATVIDSLSEAPVSASNTSATPSRPVSRQLRSNPSTPLRSSMKPSSSVSHRAITPSASSQRSVNDNEPSSYLSLPPRTPSTSTKGALRRANTMDSSSVSNSNTPIRKPQSAKSITNSKSTGEDTDVIVSTTPKRTTVSTPSGRGTSAPSSRSVATPKRTESMNNIPSSPIVTTADDEAKENGNSTDLTVSNTVPVTEESKGTVNDNADNYENDPFDETISPLPETTKPVTDETVFTTGKSIEEVPVETKDGTVVEGPTVTIPSSEPFAVATTSSLVSPSDHSYDNETFDPETPKVTTVPTDKGFVPSVDGPKVTRDEEPTVDKVLMVSVKPTNDVDAPKDDGENTSTSPHNANSTNNANSGGETLELSDEFDHF